MSDARRREAGMAENPYLMEVQNVTKAFGAVQAIHGISFGIRRNEIVGLLGDNGAGKSTTIKIITGVYSPDYGEILFEGKKVRFRSPKESRDMGIETVYQGAPLIELLSIYRNFFLGREKLRSIGPFRVLNKKGMKEECERSLKHIGIRVRTSEEPVAILSGGERQSISIGRCMHFGVKLLILDEPLNNLSLKETQVVLGHAQAVRDQGVSVIFISHNIHQLYPIADRFVIIEEGKVIENVEKKDTSLEQVIRVIAEGKFRASRL
jgi:simple sugar transport system ATP-binding protein